MESVLVLGAGRYGTPPAFKRRSPGLRGAQAGSREAWPQFPARYGALEMSLGANKTGSFYRHQSALVRNWYLTDLDGYQQLVRFRYSLVVRF